MRSPALATVNSHTLFARACAAIFLNSGLASDPAEPTNLVGYIPLGVLFGVLFSLLRPLHRFILWAVITAVFAVMAEYWFEVYHRLLHFSGPMLLINCCYICGTLIHLETEKIERSRTLALDLQMQAEQERQRIAKDLHDEALPSLSRVMRLADQLQDEDKESLIPAEIRSRLEATVTEMRRVINDLHPAVLDNLGLAASLQHLANRCSQETEIQTTFRAQSEEISIPSFQALCIYRIAQEALNNVEKHAGASHAEVSLDRTEHHLCLRVSDNGSGALTRKPESLGLKNIDDRAKLIGAKVEWKKPHQYESGTMLVLTVPLSVPPKEIVKKAPRARKHLAH